MLEHEIAPFADRHIAELDAVYNTLRLLHENHQTNPHLGITLESLEDDMKRVSGAMNALVRFKVCMADEVNQKTTFKKRWMEKIPLPWEK